MRGFILGVVACERQLVLTLKEQREGGLRLERDRHTVVDVFGAGVYLLGVIGYRHIGNGPWEVRALKVCPCVHAVSEHGVY